MINAKTKYGVEVNDVARTYCIENGLMVYESIENIEDDTVDVVYSTDVLEHCTNPFDILLLVNRKLKSGGKAIFGVPAENPETEYHRHDMENHLYSWNPKNLGNLFKTAGFFVRRVERIADEIILQEEEKNPLLITNLMELQKTMISGNGYIIIEAEVNH